MGSVAEPSDNVIVGEVFVPLVKFLFVSVFAEAAVTIMASTDKITSVPLTVEVIPIPPRIPKVSPLALIVAKVEVSSFTLILADKVVPSPIAVYISSKFRLTLLAPARRLSPVPSFGTEPLLIKTFALSFFNFLFF